MAFKCQLCANNFDSNLDGSFFYFHFSVNKRIMPRACLMKTRKVLNGKKNFQIFQTTDPINSAVA